MISSSSASNAITQHVTCLGCGCGCDDIGVVVSDGRIVETAAACGLGAAWFGDGRVPGLAMTDGRETTEDAALDAAAALLRDAASPLVFIAPDLSCEAQRQAVALADLLGGSLDSVTSSTAMASILAAQERGRAAATLGEVRNRADLLMFWGVDPERAYPRYTTRYAPLPVGVHAPGGRRSRLVIAVDIGADSNTRGPDDADLRVALDPGAEVDALTTLAAMMGGIGPTEPPELRDLATRFRAARYVAIVADGETGLDVAGVGDGRANALIALAQAINGPTRGALSLLRAGGNRSGADAVMTAQTGYPAAVDFCRGAPRYRPRDGAVARLTRSEVDAVAILGAAERIPADLRHLLASVPGVVIGPKASGGGSDGASGGPSGGDVARRRVLIDTGVAGIHDAGTAMRMDDVPLRLQQVVGGPRSAAMTIAALVDRVRRP